MRLLNEQEIIDNIDVENDQDYISDGVTLAIPSVDRLLKAQQRLDIDEMADYLVDGKAIIRLKDRIVVNIPELYKRIQYLEQLKESE